METQDMHSNSLALAIAALTLTALPVASLAQHDHHMGGDQAARPAAAATVPNAGQAIEIQVTGDGFVPANIKVKKGQLVRLVVTRKTDRTCATEIVIRDQGINQKLPLNRPVTVEFTPSKSGQLRYACGMDMISGVIVVE
jgi:plastocyanin domain-containing protein